MLFEMPAVEHKAQLTLLGLLSKSGTGFEPKGTTPALPNHLANAECRDAMLQAIISIHRLCIWMIHSDTLACAGTASHLQRMQLGWAMWTYLEI